MIDKISSVDVAYGVSQATLLPLNMDSEKNNSYDSLMKSIFQSSAKIMQKASVGLERAKDAEKELKKEKKRAERTEKENALNAQLLKEAWEEVEALNRENADLKRRSEEVEHDLCDQLAAAKTRAEAEYDRAVVVITDNYRAQMPAVKDAI